MAVWFHVSAFLRLLEASAVAQILQDDSAYYTLADRAKKGHDTHEVPQTTDWPLTDGATSKDMKETRGDMRETPGDMRETSKETGRGWRDEYFRYKDGVCSWCEHYKPRTKQLDDGGDADLFVCEHDVYRHVYICEDCERFVIRRADPDQLALIDEWGWCVKECAADEALRRLALPALEAFVQNTLKKTTILKEYVLVEEFERARETWTRVCVRMCDLERQVMFAQRSRVRFGHHFHATFVRVFMERAWPSHEEDQRERIGQARLAHAADMLEPVPMGRKRRRLMDEIRVKKDDASVRLFLAQCAHSVWGEDLMAWREEQNFMKILSCSSAIQGHLLIAKNLLSHPLSHFIANVCLSILKPSLVFGACLSGHDYAAIWTTFRIVLEDQRDDTNLLIKTIRHAIQTWRSEILWVEPGVINAVHELETPLGDTETPVKVRRKTARELHAEAELARDESETLLTLLRAQLG